MNEDEKRNKLVLEHMHIAKISASQFFRKYRQFGVEYDDLLQSARVGLIQGAAAIVEKKNVKDIPAYLLLSANNECKNLLVISGLLKFRKRKQHPFLIPASDLSGSEYNFFCGNVKKVSCF